jgi:hypothetical protein
MEFSALAVRRTGIPAGAIAIHLNLRIIFENTSSCGIIMGLLCLDFFI